MVNYAVDPSALRPLVPAGTELDAWRGTTYASLVAFSFLRTRVRGVRIPFHEDFEEINLRFYVRRRDGTEWKRGVVFVKEIVPKPAIALVARLLYNERYVALPTRHTLSHGDTPRVCYEWRFRGRWNRLSAAWQGPARPMAESSEEQFIAEHYWGYSAQRDGSTQEYRVDHPPWNVWTASAPDVDVDTVGLYGAVLARALDHEPTSIFIADGSPVTVSSGRRIQV